VLPSHGRDRKLYSTITAGHVERKYKLIVRSKAKHLPDMIKKLLKSQVNPTEIKMGIASLKSLSDGKVMIEVSSKDEIETLRNKIEGKCGQLDVNIQKFRNPRLVLLSTSTKTSHLKMLRKPSQYKTQN
jgi:hypothetical protein